MVFLVVYRNKTKKSMRSRKQVGKYGKTDKYCMVFLFSDQSFKKVWEKTPISYLQRWCVDYVCCGDYYGNRTTKRSKRFLKVIQNKNKAFVEWSYFYKLETITLGDLDNVTIKSYAIGQS